MDDDSALLGFPSPQLLSPLHGTPQHPSHLMPPASLLGLCFFIGRQPGRRPRALAPPTAEWRGGRPHTRIRTSARIPHPAFPKSTSKYPFACVCVLRVLPASCTLQLCNTKRARARTAARVQLRLPACQPLAHLAERLVMPFWTFCTSFFAFAARDPSYPSVHPSIHPSIPLA